MLRGVGLRGREPCSLALVTNRLAACKAELGACRQLGATLSAGDSETDPAPETKLRLGRILVMAPGTPHPGPPALQGDGMALSFTLAGLFHVGKSVVSRGLGTD